jgi:hypothetical protein
VGKNMARFLQLLLDAKEPMFSVGLIRLEKSTGRSGVDARLIADITEKAHKIMRYLGLDTHDTTGRELYFALVESVKRGKSELLLADADYVLIMLDNKIISFNLIDIIENTHHGLSYDKQIISHGQRSLRGELVGRYVDHERTHESTTLEIAADIGLLPESDTWYTNDKYQQKQTGKNSKRLTK